MLQVEEKCWATDFCIEKVIDSAEIDVAASSSEENLE